MTATLKELKTVPFVPPKGHRQLSINLEVVGISEARRIADALQLEAEIVEVKLRGDKSELHAMLWQGPVEETPENIDSMLLWLGDNANTDAIRYVTGHGIKRAAA